MKEITKEKLEKFFNQIKTQKNIFAPVSQNEKTEFVKNPSFANINFDFIQTTQSAKHLVFPRIEKLFEYSSSKTETSLRDVDTNLFSEVVLFAAHPCDAAAFCVLNQVFTKDYVDEIFAARMGKLTIIGLACKNSDENCFCTSVNLSPDSRKNSDIFLIPLKNGNFAVEILTKKGENLVSQSENLFENFSNSDFLITSVEKKFELSKVTAKAGTFFENDFWKTNSLRCLGCGACAFVCPVCSCFDIQDKKCGKNGERVRCWDSCGFSLFTLHTSGHNPREIQSQRWRQRILHKFSYIPEQEISQSGCTGCGRCSRNCPVDMNLLEQLTELNK